MGVCGWGEEIVGPSLQSMATLCCRPLVLSVDALGYVTSWSGPCSVLLARSRLWPSFPSSHMLA